MRTLSKPLLTAIGLCLLSASAPSMASADEAAADAWLATAREAAQANEHTKSIRAFEHAMREDPAKRPEILREYADQLTYGGRGNDAVPLYREVLDTPGISAGETTSARRGLALALSWTDQQLPSLREYQALVAANPRLLNYARGGGLLVVQYQQYPFVRGGHPPYPLEIDRPHDRVTDETAPVRLLEPEHPVFNVPNRLDAGDWEGWVQERGLYFAGTWDDAYRPLVAMADPGGEEQRGALLVARLGEGHYVYTGLAFFRQLPAGVTGAYRLFANLLGLGTGGGGDSGAAR